jgi:hypothetical protein
MTTRTHAAICRDIDAHLGSILPERADLHRKPYRLLQNGDAQTKLRKNGALIARTFGLSMPPHTLWVHRTLPVSVHVRPIDHDSGDWHYVGNVCPHADGCVETCISTTGHYGMGQSIARTWARVLWHTARGLFVELLCCELAAAESWAVRESRRKHRRVNVAVRLNVTSDVQWARYVNLSAFPHVLAYDYTKDARRDSTRGIDLTYSVSQSWTVPAIRSAVRDGFRVAVVVPTAEDADSPTFAGLPAVNGDHSDFRPADDAVVVLLRIKRPTNGTNVDAIYAGGMVRDVRTGKVLTAAP